MTAFRWHADDPTLFLEAVRFTAAQTGFPARLIEKDYFCSILLQHLSTACGALVFKGGTCLAKIHTDFHRMSEDLDFSISIPETASRAQRRAKIDPLRRTLTALPGSLPAFRVDAPLTGSNLSRQYNATLGYKSMLDDGLETLKIEVGLREPMLTPVKPHGARTALVNPMTQDLLVARFEVPSLSYAEAMAEKVRAALTRRDVAIRDFFDIDYAVRNAGFDPTTGEILDLVVRKLAMPGNEAVNVSDERLADLRRQLDAELRPVVLPDAFEGFDLDRAFMTVRNVVKRLM